MINILMAASNEYTPYLGTCLASILVNAGEGDEFAFYIAEFEGEIAEENKLKIGELRSIRDFTLNFIDVKREEVDGFFESVHTLNMYLRLFVPDKLPELERIIYLDCDMIVLDSLSGLNSIELGENILGASLDSDVITRTGEVWEYVEKINPQYFNSGMLVMNLEKMRRDKFTEKMQEWLKGRIGLMFPDQDALNTLYKDKMVITPLRYNAQFPLIAMKNIGVISRSHQEYEQIANPAIVHFCTQQKPWLYMPEPPYKAEFRKYFNMTPWKGIKQQDKTLLNVFKKSCRRVLQTVGLR